MRFRALVLTAAAVGAILAGPVLGQETEPIRTGPEVEPLFVRAIIYPTWSLSRYDYNNDLDLVEIRTYVELRSKSQSGPLLQDARVEINGVNLEFKEDHFERRIRVPVDDLPESLILRILTDDERAVSSEYPIPDWLVIESPRPALIEAGRELKAAWGFRGRGFPVNVRAYDFKSGDLILKRDHVNESAVTIPLVELPSGTILRVYTVGSWFFKKYLQGPGLARGSEITVMPWSQVFLRIR